MKAVVIAMKMIVIPIILIEIYMNVIILFNMDLFIVQIIFVRNKIGTTSNSFISSYLFEKEYVMIMYVLTVNVIFISG